MVPPILIIEAVSFVDFLGVGFFLPLLMIYGRKIGGNHIQVGLLRSIYSTFQLGSAPLLGSLSDLKGRKPVMLAQLVLSSICYISMGFTSSINVLLVLRSLLGLVKQTQMLLKTMVADYEPSKDKQRAIYGRLMAISGAGLTLGPVVGGYVAETYPENGFSYISIGMGMCMLTNAGLILLLPNMRQRPRCGTTEKENWIKMFFGSLKQSFVALYDIDWSQYGDIFIFKGLTCFSIGVYYSIYAAFLKENFGLTPKYIGALISFQSIVASMSCCLICFINSFYTDDEDYSKRSKHILLLLSSAYLGIALAPNVIWYIFSLVPLAFGNSMSRLINLEMILNRSHGAHRGKLIGAANSVASLSGVISPMVAGMIGEWFGIDYVIYASLLSTSLGILIILYKQQFCLYDYY